MSLTVTLINADKKVHYIYFSNKSVLMQGKATAFQVIIQ